MREAMLPVGLAGFGKIAKQRYIHILERNKRVMLRSVYDPKASKKKTEAPCDIYSNFNEFLNSSISVVIITAPPKWHFCLARMALEQKKYVIVEKPMAVSTEDAEKLFEIAAENNVYIYPVHNFGFLRSVSKARKIVRDGAIGKLISCCVAQQRPKCGNEPAWVAGLPSGIVYDEATHFFYLLCDFVGAINIDASILRHNGREAKWNLIAENEDEVVATMDVSHGASPWEWWLIVRGCDGTVWVDINRDFLFVGKRRGRFPYSQYLAGLRTSAQYIKQCSQLVVKRACGIKIMHGTDVLLDEIVMSIIENREPPIKKEQAMRAIRLTEEAVGGGAKDCE